eukprot:885629-Pyramimonas_sp.AAC.1
MSPTTLRTYNAFLFPRASRSGPISSAPAKVVAPEQPATIAPFDSTTAEAAPPWTSARMPA